MEQSATITYCTKAELTLNGKKVENPSEVLGVHARSIANRKKSIELELRNSNSLKGNIHGTIFLKTTDPLQKEVVINMYAFFR